VAIGVVAAVLIVCSFFGGGAPDAGLQAASIASAPMFSNLPVLSIMSALRRLEHPAVFAEGCGLGLDQRQANNTPAIANRRLPYQGGR
jgi:hypothetical protein